MEIGLPRDFKEFLRLLKAHGVAYLLIGGHAVGYHGYPRATQDLDIWVAISPTNAERMVAAVREFGFDVPELSAALFRPPRWRRSLPDQPQAPEINKKASGRYKDLDDLENLP